VGREGNFLNISEIARVHGFSGPRYHRYADLGTDNNVVVDYSGGRKNSIYTSVDCYVSGTYTGNNGEVREVKRRYSVYVSYNKDTQMVAMADVRKRIIDDFSNNYPDFRISDIFIPEQKFITPLGQGGLVEDMEYYYGSQLFKNMSRLDVARYKINTEKDIYTRNVANIKKRYGI
jgi:hypothetical protein